MASPQTPLSAAWESTPAAAPTTAPPPTAAHPRWRAKRPDSLWYALHFSQLRSLPEARRRRYLFELAGHMRDCSADIGLRESALVCEMRSALRYFGGIEVIQEKIVGAVKRQLRGWGLAEEFSHAAAPTITGALLLARAGLPAAAVGRCAAVRSPC